MRQDRVSAKSPSPREIPTRSLQLASIKILKSLGSALGPQGENTRIQYFEDKVTTSQYQCQVKAIQIIFNIFMQTKYISWIVYIRWRQVNKNKELTVRYCTAICAHSAREPCSDRESDTFSCCGDHSMTRNCFWPLKTLTWCAPS